MHLHKLSNSGIRYSDPRCRVYFSVRITSPGVNSIFWHDSRGFHDPVFEFTFFVSPTRPEPTLSPLGESGRLPDVVQAFLFESPRPVLIRYSGSTRVGFIIPFFEFSFFVSPTRPEPALSPSGKSSRLPDVVQIFLYESTRPMLISYFGPTCVGFRTSFCVFIFRVTDLPRASPEPAGRVGSTPRCRASFSVQINSPCVNFIFSPDSCGYHDPFLRFHFFVSPTRPDPSMSPPGEPSRLPRCRVCFPVRNTSPRVNLVFWPDSLGFHDPFLHFPFSCRRPATSQP